MWRLPLPSFVPPQGRQEKRIVAWEPVNDASPVVSVCVLSDSAAFLKHGEGRKGGTNWNRTAPQSLERMQKGTTIVNTADWLLAWGVCLSVCLSVCRACHDRRDECAFFVNRTRLVP
jgi:hypothetical protein